MSSLYAEFKNNLLEQGCFKCPALCKDRTHIVIDRGTPKSQLIIIGEAPGENEDLSGLSFVGRAGKVLDKVMASVDIDTNQDALILNVVKCRPPKNRPPSFEEAQNCLPYLKKQIELVQPKTIVLLGATAAKHFLPDFKAGFMKQMVGKIFSVKGFEGIHFLLLYHPAYLLRDPRKMKDMLEHVQNLKNLMPNPV